MLISHTYKAFGFNIKSAFRLPAIECCPESAADIEIVIGNVTPQGLEKVLLQKAFTQVNEKQFWFEIPFIGRFLIEQGCRITIEPAENSDEASIVSVIKGVCFQIALMQKHKVVYSGAAVSFNGECALILGDAAVGKSSLAANLQRKGLSVIGDDLIAIEEDKSVNQGWSQVSLWQDSCDALGIDSSSLKRVRPQINKFYVDLPPIAPAQLKTIYVLQAHNKPVVELSEVKGMDKFTFLMRRTEKIEDWELFACKQSIMSSIVSLVQNIRLISISFPRMNGYNEITEAVMQDLDTSHVAE